MPNDVASSRPRSSGLHLSVGPIHAGWADATVRSDRYWAQLRASYLSDAIGDLVDSVGQLIGESAEARCSWFVEPGAYRWIFTRADDVVGLRILGFRDADDFQPDDAGTFVFETTVTLPALAAAVARSVRWTLHGSDTAYETAWGHPFPQRQLAVVDRYLALS